MAKPAVRLELGTFNEKGPKLKEANFSEILDNKIDCSCCCNWQASETLSGMYKFELVQYIYLYGGTCAISSTCHTYVMWVELGMELCTLV